MPLRRRFRYDGRYYYDIYGCHTLLYLMFLYTTSTFHFRSFFHSCHRRFDAAISYFLLRCRYHIFPSRIFVAHAFAYAAFTLPCVFLPLFFEPRHDFDDAMIRYY